MNNWRLLLLALVAVFRPIASFTERSLVDGRQQCCDRQSSTPSRDTRSSLHGTYRTDKTSYAQQRLNDWDDIFKDRRYELKDSIFSRPLTERPLLDSRERGSRQDTTATVRSSRVEYRLQRIPNDHSHESLLRLEKKTFTNILDLKPEGQSRKGTSFIAVERRNDRSNIPYSRNRLSRDRTSTSRFSDERLSKNLFNAQREIQSGEFRIGELRLTLKKGAGDHFRRTRNNVAHTEASYFLNNQRHITRENANVVRRENLVRADIRYEKDINNHRNQEQRSNQNGFRSVNTRLVERIHDVHIQRNSREENRETRQRIHTDRRLTTNGHYQQRDDYRERNKENINRKLSRDMIQPIRRFSLESRKTTTPNERDVDGHWGTEYNKRVFKESRDEINEIPNHRLLRGMIQMDRRIPRESRISRSRSERDSDSGREIKKSKRLLKETRDENKEISDHRLSHERFQLVRQNTRESRITNIEREEDGQQEVRYNERIYRDVRTERVNAGYRTFRERMQTTQKIDRRSIIITDIGVGPESRMFRRTLPQRGIPENSRRNNRKVRNTKETRDEIRANSDQKLSRTNIQTDRAIRDYRINYEMTIRNNRHVVSQQDIRNNGGMTRETRDDNRENAVHRLSHERTQLNQKNVLESRTMKAERNIDRVSKDIREEIRPNTDLGKRQIDRRLIHESRIMNATPRSEKPSLQNQDRLFTRERRVESRAPGKIIDVKKDNLEADRRARSVDRNNFREIGTKARFSRSADSVRGSDAFQSRVDYVIKIENREREPFDVRYRNVDSARNLENSVMLRKIETENDAIVGSWQYFLYTLQVAYLGALIVQILTSRTKNNNIMGLHWLPASSHYNPIKVD